MGHMGLFNYFSNLFQIPAPTQAPAASLGQYLPALLQGTPPDAADLQGSYPSLEDTGLLPQQRSYPSVQGNFGVLGSRTPLTLSGGRPVIYPPDGPVNPTPYWNPNAGLLRAATGRSPSIPVTRPLAPRGPRNHFSA